MPATTGGDADARAAALSARIGIRCLKRYIARETYKAPCRPQRPENVTRAANKQDLSAPVLT